MKKLINGILALSLISSMMLPLSVSATDGTNNGLSEGNSNSSISEEQLEYGVNLVKLGDINLDQDVNAVDLLGLKKHLLGLENITNKVSLIGANIKQDETINVLDLLGMKKHLLGIEELDTTTRYIGNLVASNIVYYLDNDKQLIVSEESNANTGKLLKLQGVNIPELLMTVGLDGVSADDNYLRVENKDSKLDLTAEGNSYSITQNCINIDKSINCNYSQDTNIASIQCGNLEINYDDTVDLSYDHEFKRSNYTDFNDVAEFMLDDFNQKLGEGNVNATSKLIDYNKETGQLNTKVGNWVLREDNSDTKIVYYNDREYLNYTSNTIQLPNLPEIVLNVNSANELCINDMTLDRFKYYLQENYTCTIEYNTTTDNKYILYINNNKGESYSITCTSDAGSLNITNVKYACLKNEADSIYTNTQIIFTDEELQNANAQILNLNTESTKSVITYTECTELNVDSLRESNSDEIQTEWGSIDILKIENLTPGDIYSKIETTVYKNGTVHGVAKLTESYHTVNEIVIDGNVVASEINYDDNEKICLSETISYSNTINNAISVCKGKFTDMTEGFYTTTDSEYLRYLYGYDKYGNINYELYGSIIYIDNNSSIWVSNLNENLSVQALQSLGSTSQYEEIKVPLSNSEDLLKDSEITYSYKKTQGNTVLNDIITDFIPSQVMKNAYYE